MKIETFYLAQIDVYFENDCFLKASSAHFTHNIQDTIDIIETIGTIENWVKLRMRESYNIFLSVIL